MSKKSLMLEPGALFVTKQHLLFREHLNDIFANLSMPKGVLLFFLESIFVPKIGHIIEKFLIVEQQKVVYIMSNTLDNTTIRAYKEPKPKKTRESKVKKNE